MKVGDTMGQPDLRTYLSDLRADDQLVRVDREVSAAGEISAVTKALEPAGKPAVYFSQVRDSELPVAIGLFGTRRRLATSLGKDVDGLVPYVSELRTRSLPTPIRVTDAPVHAVRRTGDDIDLGELPIGVHSRGDAGRYLTSGVVVATDPETGNVNTGMYRMMVKGRNELTVNAAPDHDLGRIFASAAAAGKSVPIAIVIGHHPAYAIASQLKNSTAIDAHELAGALLGEPLEVVQGSTVDVEYPAHAEVVLEGVVRPTDKLDEGPFGEFTYYHGAAQAPVCQVTAVHRRDEAIFHDLHPTHDEHRCLWLFPGREARLYDAVPSLRAVRIPFHGGALCAYLSVEKRRQGDGKQAILAAFATDHFLKHVIVVDADIDVFDDHEVLWALHCRFQAEHDLIAMSRMKGIRMDPSAIAVDESGDRITSKLGFDATVPLHPPFPERADRAVDAFAEIVLDDYVDPANLGHVRQLLRTRTLIEE